MAGKTAEDRIREKKKRQQTMYMGIGAVFVLVAALAAGYYLLEGGPGETATTYNRPGADAGGQNVLVPLAELADGSFHYYSHGSSGTTIKYFVVRDSSGNVHTAFDACDVCYHAKKGYSQSGVYAKCNNCDMTFAVAGIGTENTGGGCWPAYLPHEITDGNVVIKKSDLDAGKHYFE